MEKVVLPQYYRGPSHTAKGGDMGESRRVHRRSIPCRAADAAAAGPHPGGHARRRPELRYETDTVGMVSLPSTSPTTPTSVDLRRARARRAQATPRHGPGTRPSRLRPAPQGQHPALPDCRTGGEVAASWTPASELAIQQGDADAGLPVALGAPGRRPGQVVGAERTQLVRGSVLLDGDVDVLAISLPTRIDVPAA